MIGFQLLALVLCLVAFVFMLLALILGPVAPTLKLAEAGSTVFGIFGYVTGNTKTKGYPIAILKADTGVSDWLFSSLRRDTVAKAFVVAPIACGLAFLAIIAYGFGHVTRVGRIVGFVLNLLAFAACVATCVTVVLAFYPHVGVIGWLTVAAAGCALIALVMGGVSLCFGGRDDEYDENDLELYTAGYTSQKFDDKFANVQTNTISLPHTNDTQGYDFAAKPFNHQQPTKTVTNDLGSVGSNRHMQAPPDLVVGLVALHPVVPKLAPRVTPAMAAATGNINDPYGNPTQFSHNQAVARGEPQAPYPTGAPLLTYDALVFEHHPNVEGHQPFTEMDDYDVGEDVVRNYHLDLDLDFTSVSQREPNPYYNGNPPPPPPHQQYPNVQQFAPNYNQQFMQLQSQPYHGNVAPRGYAPQASPPARGPTTSEQVLNQNPDFNFVGATRQKRAQAPGFVPVAARYKQGGGRPAANQGPRSGPYSIT